MTYAEVFFWVLRVSAVSYFSFWQAFLLSIVASIFHLFFNSPFLKKRYINVFMHEINRQSACHIYTTAFYKGCRIPIWHQTSVRGGCCGLQPTALLCVFCKYAMGSLLLFFTNILHNLCAITTTTWILAAGTALHANNLLLIKDTWTVCSEKET